MGSGAEVKVGVATTEASPQKQPKEHTPAPHLKKST